MYSLWYRAYMIHIKIYEGGNGSGHPPPPYGSLPIARLAPAAAPSCQHTHAPSWKPRSLFAEPPPTPAALSQGPISAPRARATAHLTPPLGLGPPFEGTQYRLVVRRADRFMGPAHRARLGNDGCTCDCAIRGQSPLSADAPTSPHLPLPAGREDEEYQ